MDKVLLVANTDWYLYNYRLPFLHHLRQSGFEVVLVSPSGQYVPRLEQEGFRHVAWEVGRQSIAPWTEMDALFKLSAIYKCERPVLAHHFTIKPVLYGSSAARRLKIPAVVNSITGRGVVFQGQVKWARWLQPGVKLFYKQAFSHPNSAAIFENDGDRDFFLEQGFVSPGRAWVTNGVGVDAGRFSPQPEPEGVPLIVLAARLLWDKGVGTLVNAARILHERMEVRVALVGQPDPGNPSSIERETLQKWVAEGVVEWWGWQEEMQKVYSGCHIVALPTFSEGAPVSLIEAAACGKPIVATDIPGCRVVVQDGVNGFLVPVDDPQKLAEALERLARSPELRTRMGAAGRKRVLESLTFEKVNAATLRVYQTLLGAAPDR